MTKKISDLEDKYYPIRWEIDPSSEEIIIYSKNGNLLPKDHVIYDIELNFIYEQINKYHLTDGEIVGV